MKCLVSCGYQMKAKCSSRFAAAISNSQPAADAAGYDFWSYLPPLSKKLIFT
jgi:hypothetical protein